MVVANGAWGGVGGVRVRVIRVIVVFVSVGMGMVGMHCFFVEIQYDVKIEGTNKVNDMMSYCLKYHGPSLCLP